MSVCTFFGNGRLPNCVKEELREVIRGLIKRHMVSDFLVGNQGDFDRMVLGALRELKEEYTHIRYAVVLAYHPSQSETMRYAENETVLPEEVVRVPKRLAIIRRNEWLLSRATIVITCVPDITGNAARWKELAKKRGKP